MIILLIGNAHTTTNAKDMLLFEEKIPQSYRQQFVDRVVKMADTLQTKPEWHMAIFNNESGLNSSVVNIACSNAGGTADSCGVGLIGFMPTTAQWLGTTGSQLVSMSAVKQLDYVEKFYSRYKNKITSYTDLYLVTFRPADLGKPDSFIFPLTQQGYEQNKGMDMDKDGKISMADFKKFAYAKLPPEVVRQFQTEGLEKTVLAEKYVKRNWLPILLITFTAIVVTYTAVRFYGR